MNKKTCPMCKSNNTQQIWELDEKTHKWLIPPRERECITCGHVWEVQVKNDIQEDTA